METVVDHTFSSSMQDATAAASLSVAATGCLTILFASLLGAVFLYVQKRQQNSLRSSNTDKGGDELVEINKHDYPGGIISVYYGTQTGTAESFARQLEREGPEHGFYIHVLDLEDMQVEQLLEEKCKDQDTGIARVILLAATYGEGEAPDNAALFAEELKEKSGTDIVWDEKKQPLDTILVAEPNCLEGVEFVVFGLGNKQYDHYNVMGKFFDRALQLVGGKRLMELGLGDDDDDLEGDFEAWKDQKLWPMLEKTYLPDGFKKNNKANSNGHDHANSNGTTNGSSKMPDCQYAIEYIVPNGKPIVPNMNLAEHQIHGQGRHYFSAVDCPVTVVRELRSQTTLTAEDGGGSTVHIEVDISQAAKQGKSALKYQTADNFGVLPLNQTNIVEAVANKLGYDLNAYFSLSAAPGHDWHGAPFPMPCSVREALTRYTDLQASPRRSDLKLLAAYATDVIDQKALLRMSSLEGKAEYRQKIVDDYIGIADLICKKCPSLQMPLEHFLNLCPMLQTRFYTISSSSSVHPTSVHMTVAVTKATRPSDGSTFHGVCSHHMATRCQPQVRHDCVLRVFNRPSSFRLPHDTTRPIILIGPGTGIAPMRALLQERAYQKSVLKKNVGTNVLYFGCQKRTLDFLYQDELQAFVDNGTLHQLHLAFSREQKEKIYVQHVLSSNAKDTWNLIDAQGAYIYVCGAVKMGHDVQEALKEIIQSQSGTTCKTPEEAKDYLNRLAKNGRYVQELWA
jgi:NADPH-ferrihemoprotein reductase